MSERGNFAPDKVLSLGITEIRGQIVQRDLAIFSSGKTYVLSVGTQDYLDALKLYNQRFSEDQRFDENILVLESVNPLESVISILFSMELEEVLPYITEQEEPTES